MDNMKEALKLTMDSITEKRDIVSAAKIRASEVTAGARRSFTAMTAAVMAVIVCGFTAAAVNLGWLQMLFGDSSKNIEESIDDYTLEIGNTEITYTNPDMPFTFTVGEAISDGETIYLSLLIDIPAGTLPQDMKEFHLSPSMKLSRKTGEKPYLFGAHLMWLSPLKNEGVSQRRSSDVKWQALASDGGTANAAIYMSFSDEIKKGDRLSVYIQELYPMSEDVLANQKHSFENNNVIISFDVLSDPVNMSKTIEAHGDAAMTINGYEGIMSVDSVEVSPLKFTVKGTHSSGTNMSTMFLGAPSGFAFAEISFTLKNGDVIIASCDSVSMMQKRSHDGDKITFLDEYECVITGHFGKVIPYDEIESVRLGDLTIPVE